MTTQKKDAPYTFEEPCLACHGEGIRFGDHTELSAICQRCGGSGHTRHEMTPEELRETERAFAVRALKGEHKFSI